MTLSLLHRPNEVRRFLEACRTRRADVALIGDSNIFSATTSGYANGWEHAWGRRFGLYATGVRSFAPGNANFTTGYHYAGGAGYASGTLAAQVAAIVPDGAFGGGASYRESGDAGTGFGDVALELRVDHPNGTQAAWRWVVCYATFATGAGSTTLAIRQAGSLYHFSGAAIADTNTGAYGTAVAESPVAAGASPLGSNAWCILQPFNQEFGPHLVGPFAALWQRVTWDDKVRGVGVTPMIVQGGQPTRAAANVLAAMTQAQFDAWAQLVVGQQGDEPMLLVQLLQGANDTADTADSVGPNPVASNTPAGVVDNTAAVVGRLRTLWAGAGHDPQNMFFLIGPYHPQEETRRAWGRHLDDAFAAYADGERNVAVASRSRVSTSAYVRHKGWYADGSDAHLTAGGYYGWAELAANAVAPAPAAVVRHATGAALDLRLFDEAGQVFDAARGSFGAWDDADQADYAVAGLELGTGGVYRFALPAELRGPAGLRGVVTARAGADPALDDPHVATLGPDDFDGLGDVGPRHLANDLREQADELRAQAESLRAQRERIEAYLDAPVSRAGSGGGTVAVDHDTGGTDALRYVAGGVGVGGAVVRAYVRADYDAGLYVERGRAATRDDGRWAGPIYLSPGVEYALTFAKPGVYQVSRRDVTV